MSIKMNFTSGNKRAIIFQARVGSTRMPNKILEPFCENKGVLEVLLDRVSSQINIPIIVATSVNPKDEAIKVIASKCNVHFFCGDENNVLKRFIDTAEHFGINEIIRVCPDNPFLDLISLNYLCTESFDGYDYAGYQINGCPSIKTHYGFWAEYTTIASLKKVSALTSEQLFTEHVTNYMYQNTNHFKTKLIDPFDDIDLEKPIRLTLDTKEDFAMLREIYAGIVKKNKSFGINEVIQYLSSNPHYYHLMKGQIVANQK